MTIAHRCHRCGRVEATTRLPIPYGWRGLTRRRIWLCEACIETIASADVTRAPWTPDVLVHYEARALRARRAAHRMVERHGRTEELRRYCAGGDPATTERGES